MKKLLRFGVSMEKSLLEEFDALINTEGYTNRSEAIRDIVRDRLVEESIRDSGAGAYGALVYLYDHHQRELEKSLANIQHEYFKNIISTSHVHIDHDNCFEVILLRGKVGEIKSIADRMLSMKGVKHGKLTLTTAIKQEKNKSSHKHKIK